jgi:hypothetical protein
VCMNHMEHINKSNICQNAKILLLQYLLDRLLLVLESEAIILFILRVMSVNRSRQSKLRREPVFKNT